jgi:protein TonB
MLGSGAAFAGDTPAHVDSSQPNMQPIYPDSARAAGEQGTVLIDVMVHASGRPGQYRVAQSSGFGDLDAAALETVLNWKYVPATRDGDTVSDWASVKVVYELPKTASETQTTPAQ